MTNAGGFGVLGGAAFTPEQLEHELDWIDDHVKGKPYGVDIIVPGQVRGQGRGSDRGPDRRRIPGRYRDFVFDLLAEHDIELDDIGGSVRRLAQPATPVKSCSTSRSGHPIKLIANALGVPPDYMIEARQGRGVPVAALVGAKEHAVKQVQAGVDI